MNELSLLSIPVTNISFLFQNNNNARKKRDVFDHLPDVLTESLFKFLVQYYT